MLRSRPPFPGPDSDVLVNISFRILSHLPLSWLHRLGGWAGWLVGDDRRMRATSLAMVLEIHSSFTSSFTRGSTRSTSAPRASTRMFEPTASMASMDSVLRSSHGRATKA